MSGVPKRWLREVRRSAIAEQLVRRIFAGHAVECPCCHSEFRKFRGFNGPDRVCWVCGSMERHRALWLFLDSRPDLLRDGMSILHVAPERVLRDRLVAVPGVNYVGGDLTAEFGPVKIDVTDLQFADGEFDAVICNHVLEHVPDDGRAMREIRRVTKAGGWAVLQVPDLEWNSLSETSEAPELRDPDEQARRFGQRDHVRRYGWDYVERLSRAGFDVEVVRLEDALQESDIARFRLRKRGFVEPIFFARPTAA